LTDEVARLSRGFINYTVHQEVAICTMIIFLEPQDQWDSLNTAYIWGTGRQDPISKYSREYDWIHPFKLSIKGVSAFLQSEFQAAVHDGRWDSPNATELLSRARWLRHM
jgi:hypothetical protein